MPGLAQRFQDDSSSDGSTGDISFDLGPPPPLIQQNCDIFDSSDDNSSYSDDSATMPLSVSTPTSESSICSSKPDDSLSFLTASDYESQQGIDNDDDGDASFVTAASSAYESTGSIIFELPDDNTQPIGRHVYLLFVTPKDTDKNDASIQFYFENKDEVDEHHQSKLIDPAKPRASMFYNPSTVQDVYDKDKFSSYLIDEILNLCLYKDITGQNTKRTYAETLSVEAQEYCALI